MKYLFTLILFAISVYVLYSAATAKGKLFATENIYEEKIPQFTKLLRCIYLALGIVMLFMALLSGLQDGLYGSDKYAYRLNDQFRTDYASSIKSNGVIKGTEYHVDGYFHAGTVEQLLPTLPQPEQAEGETQNSVHAYIEIATDENDKPLYMLKSETEPNQNETYAKWRAAIPFSLVSLFTYIFMGVTLLIIVVLFFLINKFTDKEKAAKAKAQQTGTAMPAAAFRFDEEEQGV